MKQSFTPANPAPNLSLNVIRSLPFQATDVTVQSGPNFVTINPSGFVVPPGIMGLVYTFSTPQSQASFTVTAPPAGQSPLGPSQVQQTLLDYSDQKLAASPGQSIAPPAQPISLIQQVSTTVGGQESITFFSGLARAVTFFCAGPNSTTWALQGQIWSGQSLIIETFTGVAFFEGSAGQGTQGVPGAGLTSHMFPSFSIQNNDPGNHFDLDARLYY